MTISTQWIKAKADDHTLVFYFTKAEHALSNLENQRLKVSEFRACNDLFELASFDLSDPDRRRKHRGWSKNLNENFGLICFSECWRSPVMWAHYADNGRGACMVFSVAQQKVRKVRYVSRRNLMREGSDLPAPTETDEFREFCSTKFSNWSYEKESRMILDYDEPELSSEDGLRFRSFDPATLCCLGLINGPRPSLCKEEYEHAGCPVGNFFQCRPAFREFRMVVQQNRKLWRQCTA